MDELRAKYPNFPELWYIGRQRWVTHQLGIILMETLHHVLKGHQITVNHKIMAKGINPDQPPLLIGTPDDKMPAAIRIEKVMRASMIKGKLDILVARVEGSGRVTPIAAASMWDKRLWTMSGFSRAPTIPRWRPKGKQ